MLVFNGESLAVQLMSFWRLCVMEGGHFILWMSVIQDGYGCKLIDVDSFV